MSRPMAQACRRAHDRHHDRGFDFQSDALYQADILKRSICVTIRKACCVCMSISAPGL